MQAFVWQAAPLRAIRLALRAPRLALRALRLALRFIRLALRALRLALRVIRLSLRAIRPALQTIRLESRCRSGLAGSPQLEATLVAQLWRNRCGRMITRSGRRQTILQCNAAKPLLELAPAQLRPHPRLLALAFFHCKAANTAPVPHAPPPLPARQRGDGGGGGAARLQNAGRAGPQLQRHQRQRADQPCLRCGSDLI